MRTGLYEEKEEKKESKRKEQFDCGFLLVCVTAQLSACCTGRKPKPDEKKKIWRCRVSSDAPVVWALLQPTTERVLEIDLWFVLKIVSLSLRSKFNGSDM